VSPTSSRNGTASARWWSKTTTSICSLCRRGLLQLCPRHGPASVRGGLPRAYFLGVEASDEVCGRSAWSPRGTEEGSTLSLDLESLQLVANRPRLVPALQVRLIRTEDKTGDIVEFSPKDVGQAFARNMRRSKRFIRFGKKAEERLVPVRLGAHSHRDRYAGNLGRVEKSASTAGACSSNCAARPRRAGQKSRPSAVLSADAVDKAERLIREVFERGALPPENLPALLEQALALGRNSWPLETLDALEICSSN